MKIQNYYQYLRTKKNSASAINLMNVIGVVIENNTIGKSGAKPNISKPVLFKNCKDVVNKDNKISKEEK